MQYYSTYFSCILDIFQNLLFLKQLYFAIHFHILNISTILFYYYYMSYFLVLNHYFSHNVKVNTKLIKKYKIKLIKKFNIDFPKNGSFAFHFLEIFFCYFLLSISSNLSFSRYDCPFIFITLE